MTGVNSRVLLHALKKNLLNVMVGRFFRYKE
jgi:hypothetical protein